MPYIKSISIHTGVRKALKYILNPDKTDSLLYTSSLNCMTDADGAYLNMRCFESAVESHEHTIIHSNRKD